MEFFKGAKVVRLCSQHQKYLTGSEDEETVKQYRNGSSKTARWTVEPVEGKPNLVRLKNCSSWKYLFASEEPLLGWTGKRVLQVSPRLRLDPAIEWEPIKEGSNVKMRTRNGAFLKGHGGIPPWNHSVTVDFASRSVTRDGIIWTVDVLEIDNESEESLESNLENDGQSCYSSVIGSTTLEESDSEDPLDDTEQTDLSETYETNPLHPREVEFKMAKQTLIELKDMDFKTLLSSERYKKLENSISILITNSELSSDEQIPEELSTIIHQLTFMINNHDLALQELNEYDSFITTRLEVKAQLKKDASKAHELETLETGFSNMLTSARAKRDVLLKQLEEVESSIKATKRAQADNAEEIEEVISRIGEKSQRIREMEGNEKLLMEKKIEAERVLESVEEEWVKVKDLFQDV